MKLPALPWHSLLIYSPSKHGILWWLSRKESICNADVGLILGSGRYSKGEHGNPLQYSCQENSMDRGTWWATVTGVAKVGHDLATKPPLPPLKFEPKRFSDRQGVKMRDQICHQLRQRIWGWRKNQGTALAQFKKSVSLRMNTMDELGFPDFNLRKAIWPGVNLGIVVF